TQQTTHDGDGVTGLLTLHKPKHSYRVRSVSLAKKAAAFFRISRSSRRIFTSRRSRCSSSRSCVVKPSRSPASISACRTHLRSDSKAIPRSWAITFMGLPLSRTRRTASAETQVGMVDAFAAGLNLLDGHLSDTSLLCPPNRVKLRTTPITCFMAHPPPVHPHARGDDSGPRRPLVTTCGTPPRAWGRALSPLRAPILHRYTPTRVGT